MNSLIRSHATVPATGVPAPPSASDRTKSGIDRSQIAANFLAFLEAGDGGSVSSFCAGFPPNERSDVHLLCERLAQIRTDVTSHAARTGFIGERLGDFHIVSEIGSGGMGVVYRAVQSPLRRRVALKVLAPHGGVSRRAVVRFLREAVILSQLDHPAIPGIYAAGEQDGMYFLAMEYVGGRRLSLELDRLRAGGERRRLSVLSGETDYDYWQLVARFIADIADALEHVHRQGIIHRDVKPANLLVAADLTSHLVDFGIAMAMDAPSISEPGDVVGTPAYMSPEQIQEPSSVLDHRTDVFSLGLVLREMLTANGPSGRSSNNAGPATSELLPPLELDPSVPKALEDICLTSTEREPGARFESATAMASALRAFLSDDERPTGSPGGTDHDSREVRRSGRNIAALHTPAFGLF